jgi:hypothetical protein
MTIKENTFRNAWVHQGAKPNCGSCCMGSIVNYARAIRRDAAITQMDDNAYVGLTVGGVHSLGSVSSRLYQWLTAKYPGAFRVVEVKVDGKSAHWGGALNAVTGGTSHRPKITPNATYFSHPNRFLLREFSAMVVAGHYIIQTDVDEFWDPNRAEGLLPMDLNTTKSYHSVLSERADALQIDVLLA